MLQRDLGGGRRHRRIDVDLRCRDPAFAIELHEQVDDVLRATDGERRDHDVAASHGQCLGHDLGEFVERLGHRAVEAVAVRRFHHEHVGLLDEFRIAHQRMAGLPEIAGEHDAPRAAPLVDGDLDDRRPEDVPGVDEPRAHVRMRRDRVAVLDGAQSLERRHRLHDRVERCRLAGRAAGGAAPMPEVALGLDLLDVAAVREHHPEQVGRRRRAPDRPAEAQQREARQQARVVDVGVRQQDEIDVAHVERERLAVLALGLAPALEHAAVHQEGAAGRAHPRTGSGDFAGGAEKRDFHRGWPRVVAAPRPRLVRVNVRRAWRCRPDVAGRKPDPCPGRPATALPVRHVRHGVRTPRSIMPAAGPACRRRRLRGSAGSGSRRASLPYAPFA